MAEPNQAPHDDPADRPKEPMPFLPRRARFHDVQDEVAPEAVPTTIEVAT